jgi:hypothetical protein
MHQLIVLFGIPVVSCKRLSLQAFSVKHPTDVKKAQIDALQKKLVL